MKFVDKGLNPIAICLVDVSSRCQSSTARATAANLADHLINYFWDNGFDVYVGNNEDSLLRETAQEDYSHAVVMAHGTALTMSNGFELFREIEKFCQKDFAVAGHVLDRKDSYYELHHQFYIVNLEDYRQLGCPELGLEDAGPHQQIQPIRSEENVHDDYVPLWIAQGTELANYSAKLHGWNLIRACLSANKKIIDIGPDIRARKKYFYYEYDHVFNREVSYLHYVKFFGRSFVLPLHTDNERCFKVPGIQSIDQYVTVATGFNWIRDLELTGFHSGTVVIFADMNIHALEIMRKFVTEFNGVDYQEFYNRHIALTRSMIPYDMKQPFDHWCSTLQDTWLAFKQSFPNWPDVWARVKQLRFKFVPVDYTAAFNLDWLDPGLTTVINFSDIFNFGMTAFEHSLKYKMACENRLITQLRRMNPNILVFFEIRAASGFLKNYEALPCFDRVSNLRLNDLRDLKIPPWHQDDWILEQPLV